MPSKTCPPKFFFRENNSTGVIFKVQIDRKRGLLVHGIKCHIRQQHQNAKYHLCPLEGESLSRAARLITFCTKPHTVFDLACVLDNTPLPKYFSHYSVKCGTFNFKIHFSNETWKLLKQSYLI